MKKLTFLILLWFTIPVNAQQFNSDYDEYFKKYSKQYFMGIYDWKWFKAQGIAESNLTPDAISHVGAKGIMQIMPFTGKEIGLVDFFDPKSNIEKGIYYDRRLWNVWKTPSTYWEKIYFMFASYNAGLGNIIKAQKITKSNKKIWFNNVETSLGQITGKHSEETIKYVRKIKKYYILLNGKLF